MRCESRCLCAVRRSVCCAPLCALCAAMWLCVLCGYVYCVGYAPLCALCVLCPSLARSGRGELASDPWYRLPVTVPLSAVHSLMLHAGTCVNDLGSADRAIDLT